MRSVIVVDDDAMFRTIMRRHLSQMGFQVIESASGKGVVEQIKVHAPVACLIDLVMDEKEGIETILEIGRLRCPTKVVAVSSNGKFLGFAAGLGADATLLKPVSPDVLRTTLTGLGVELE